jgi:hypothetical protein
MSLLNDEQVDLALLDVLGPYPASIHNFNVETQTWCAVDAAVSIEKKPFYGNVASKFQCFKVYNADERGHIHVCVGKEGHMSTELCQDHVLKHQSVKVCVNEFNKNLNLEKKDALEVLKMSGAPYPNSCNKTSQHMAAF